MSLCLILPFPLSCRSAPPGSRHGDGDGPGLSSLPGAVCSSNPDRAPEEPSGQALQRPPLPAVNRHIVFGQFCKPESRSQPHKFGSVRYLRHPLPLHCETQQ